MRPETLLKCANKAYPEFIWREEDGMILGAPRKSIEALGDNVRYMAPEQLAPYFNAKFSMDSGNCGMALQIALEKEGWSFRYHDTTESFTAEKKMEMRTDLWIAEKSKPALLAACVESTQE